jgi:hypothetical protein
MFTPQGENRVFKFDQSEAVYFKFRVDDVNNSRKNAGVQAHVLNEIAHSKNSRE